MGTSLLEKSRYQRLLFADGIIVRHRGKRSLKKYQSNKKLDKIFISYRTSDGIDFAGRLKERLAKKGFSVYYNPEKHAVGEPFPVYLKKAVEACKVFLIVVTPNLVSGLIENIVSGEDDYVRDELETAIKSGKKIIPILRGTDMPQDKQLPDMIKGFSVIDSIEVNSKDASDFNYGIKKVIKKVKEHCRSRRETVIKTASAFVFICILTVAVILLPTLTKKISEQATLFPH